MSFFIVPLIRKSNGDAVTVECPEFLDETVIQLLAPLSS